MMHCLSLIRNIISRRILITDSILDYSYGQALESQIIFSRRVFSDTPSAPSGGANPIPRKGIKRECFWKGTGLCSCQACEEAGCSG